MDIAYGLPFHTCPAPAYLLDGSSLGELAATAEKAGFSAVHLTDHPAPSQPWRTTGGHDGVDPFVGLAFAAAATTRLRLLTYLVVLPYRNPFHLAKLVASLDALSGGRVELGLGAGYHKAEFRALGVDWDERNALFDEALAVLRKAWTGRPVTHEGLHFTARDTVVTPPCTPPLWFGGNSRLTLRRVVENRAGWLPLPNPRATASHLRSPAMESIADFAALLDTARAHAAAVGAPPPSRVMYPLPDGDPAVHVDLARRAAEAGATSLVVNGQGRTLREATEWIDRYATTVLERLS
ncbi:TIGR03619 family F420-dependent LLM class oxidoreductase [Cryptosporangium aurantiacum]|uniref:TIGR03619 family F420-dependent LLM class oxidoreductase n=1 Tax=Cryptosporangium aurantiacum TaxID=134849 RepID=UPI0009336EDC|nr:TIGR03619 family F420-dependent LLM class oxidoreductase [Cryptosporangium aurantiacum]